MFARGVFFRGVFDPGVFAGGSAVAPIAPPVVMIAIGIGSVGRHAIGKGQIGRIEMGIGQVGWDGGHHDLSKPGILPFELGRGRLGG